MQVEKASIIQPPSLPFLRSLLWQRKIDLSELAPIEMLRLYERGWRYLQTLIPPTEAELAFIQALATQFKSDCTFMTFTRPIHRQILQVLQSLDATRLKACQAHFGSGTQLVLEFNEYRSSQDIDFICPFGEGYRQLRRAIFDLGYEALFLDQSQLRFPREIRADQYGIRFPVEIEETIIRFEIIAEGRIQLEEPQFFDWAEIPCLSRIDAIAEKLLANSDRWADASTGYRDLVDLAMLRLQSPFPTEAIEKAELVYPVLEPLGRALNYLHQHPSECIIAFEQLQVTSIKSVQTGIQQLTDEYGGVRD